MYAEDDEDDDNMVISEDFECMPDRLRHIDFGFYFFQMTCLYNISLDESIHIILDASKNARNFVHYNKNPSLKNHPKKMAIFEMTLKFVKSIKPEIGYCSSVYEFLVRYLNEHHKRLSYVFNNQGKNPPQ